MNALGTRPGMAILAFGAVTLVVGIILWSPYFSKQEAEGREDKFASDKDKKDPDKGPAPVEKKTGFAEERAMAEIKPVPFDGKRAMEYLKSICDIGPRISGSDGMKKQQELLQKHFEKYGAKVAWQKFDGKQRSKKDKIYPMANMIISWDPEAKERVIFCGHYDTRPSADEEKDPRSWARPFVSANDGGSTIALFMELAHHMKDIPRKVGIDFVLFDGEELIFDKKIDAYFLGSEHFGDQYTKVGRTKFNYRAAINLDMIGGKNASFPVEGNSYERAPKLVKAIWDEAAAQGVKAFTQDYVDTVWDDHISLLDVGIPAIDIINFRYPHWHKLTDLPENCSGDTLEQVSKVLTAWLQRERE